MKRYRHPQSHRPSRRKLKRRKAAFDALLRAMTGDAFARVVENYLTRLVLRQPVWLPDDVPEPVDIALPEA